ncbi:Sec-independent protein translocase protein TatC [Planctomycetales bacterium]|nr:Sec-independent protein translocase protein TatC [Planctomycetales bacterium]
MKDDDLFAESAMSFGEHLEELRKCFFHSIYWIAFGSVFGFLLGASVVRYIQVPVEKALSHYKDAQSEKKLDADTKKLVEEGYPSNISAVLKKHKIRSEEKWVFPGELARILSRERVQRKELEEDDVSPNEVDNLTLRKAEWKKKRQGIGMMYDSVHLDEEPIRVLFFVKNEDSSKTKALGVSEAFVIYVQASLVVGVVFASPFVAFNLWSFVAAGLYPHEKKYVYYFIPVSIVLFIGGALFAYFCVFQFVLDFLFGFNAWLNIEPDPRIKEWISFALLLPLGFGVSFQLPLVMFVLERVGIFRLNQYISSWRISILAIFILALLLTPGDPGSMLLMAFPLTILYFGGIFFCWIIPRKQGLFDADVAEN